MPLVVGIRFKDSGKTYFFSPGQVDALQQGDSVIVDTVRGPELAKVAYTPRDLPNDDLVGELKPVLRRASPNDFRRLEELNSRQPDLLARCAEKIREHDLPMRLVKAEYSFDGSRLTFYFTAEKRVDFRNLVRDLARAFRTRIELRQIGPRDEAKLLGGIGPCGRILCCATFLPDYARVSIKMAKDQDLPLNPTKISGVCGRLLCCLSYEHDQYLTIKAELPRKGAWVQTPDGPGEVVLVNVVRETVTVELHGSGVQEEFSATQVREMTERVGDLARSRAEEGIAPVVIREPRPPRPPRELKHGNRRLLRDEIEDPEVLDALSLLEEGLEDDLTPRRPALPPPALDNAPHPTPPQREAQQRRRALPPPGGARPALPPPPPGAGQSRAEPGARPTPRRRRKGDRPSDEKE